MKLISLFAITVPVQANANKASQREQMKFNFQTSKNALFKYSEMEDVEMIKSKRGVFLLYFEIIRGKCTNVLCCAYLATRRHVIQ